MAQGRAVDQTKGYLILDYVLCHLSYCTQKMVSYHLHSRFFPPLSHDNTSSPPDNKTTPSRITNSRLALRDRLASPGPYSQQVLSQTSPSARPRHLSTQSSMSALQSSANRRASLQPTSSDPSALSSPLQKPTRPASSLASNRRVSLLPQPRGRQASAVSGRESPQAIAGAATAMRATSQTSIDSKGKEKKPWR